MSAALSADLLRPPSDEDVEQALQRFAKDVRDHYGPCLVGLYLYGSRARGAHHPDSDADVAVVLSGAFDYWREVGVLSDLSYDDLVERGVYIDAKPLGLLAWNNPTSHANASLIRAIKRDCRAIGTTP
jgi:predicted nucleotidyltransferase